VSSAVSTRRASSSRSRARGGMLSARGSSTRACEVGLTIVSERSVRTGVRGLAMHATVVRTRRLGRSSGRDGEKRGRTAECSAIESGGTGRCARLGQPSVNLSRSPSPRLLSPAATLAPRAQPVLVQSCALPACSSVRAALPCYLAQSPVASEVPARHPARARPQTPPRRPLRLSRARPQRRVVSSLILSAALGSCLFQHSGAVSS
jgi:hypothetical protein